MLGSHLCQPHPAGRHAFRHGGLVESTRVTARRNHLLAALPAGDYERLLPDLVPVHLPAGGVVHRAGEPEHHLYFLSDGLVSRLYVSSTGESAEIALTGREGVIGIASFLGGRSTLYQAMTLSAGQAYRVRMDALKRESRDGGALGHLLQRYTQALIVQTGQIAVCNRFHSLEQRLCRWMLSCLDRVASTDLPVTHEVIAGLLGVRREGVTVAAGNLEKEGLIYRRRGHISVLDRSRLEARVCECYAVVKREYDRLLPEPRRLGIAA